MESGVIDHHALIFLFLKPIFTKTPQNKLQYRNYMQFEANSFLEDVEKLHKKKIVFRNWKIFCEKK